MSVSLSATDGVKVIASKASKSAPVLPRTKQASRKGTKAWRKNVDITSEEATLDELREQERLGIGRLEEKKDEELFTTDTKADEDVRIKEFGRRKLRVDDILKPKSGVLAVSTRPLKAEPAKAKREFSVAELARIQRKADALNKHPAAAATGKKNKQAERNLDIWGDADSASTTDQASEEADSFLPPPAKLNVPATLRMAPKAKTGLPAVQVAPAGASYNPRFEDHQKLLMEAIREEEERISELREIMAKAPTNSASASESAMVVDAVADSSDEEGAGLDGADADEAAQTEAYVAPLTRKLTRAERNRQARRKAEEAKAAARRAEKALRERMESLVQLHAHLAELEQEREAEIAQRKKRKAEKELMPAKLSKHRFVATPKALEVQLTEDLAGSLRKLKPEGNLAKDRFKSMQSRNIIESRIPTNMKRKYAKKVYEKRDYREFE
ncbi:ribosome biogenesis protein Nop53/GLTSCR2 [Catenaria anguillulae PL171]|uniref:Ribosome biogenesis protein NOP53 n=1 Tax=Catenaria anguillulae PL171 TaxID=765915 RepID=A0A1Y2HXJ4_9FUNG|nr:ribosome biogenesis protein Nop53/GLTSCR2 [Catenaria anguillulae PL171]